MNVSRETRITDSMIDDTILEQFAAIPGIEYPDDDVLPYNVFHTMSGVMAHVTLPDWDLHAVVVLRDGIPAWGWYQGIPDELQIVSESWAARNPG